MTFNQSTAQATPAANELKVQIESIQMEIKLRGQEHAAASPRGVPAGNGEIPAIENQATAPGSPPHMGCPRTPQPPGPIVPQRKMVQLSLTARLPLPLPMLQVPAPLLCWRQKQRQPGPYMATSSLQNLSGAATIAKK